MILPDVWPRRPLTVAELDAWAERTLPGAYVLYLEDGVTIPWSPRAHPSRVFEGPTVVEVVRFRDGGWSAHEVPLTDVRNIRFPAPEETPAP